MGVRVAVLTNGNANLTTCPVLGEYISLSLGELSKCRVKMIVVALSQYSRRVELLMSCCLRDVMRGEVWYRSALCRVLTRISVTPPRSGEDQFDYRLVTD